ncbi:MAG: ABC transporter ATP-binding protein [Acetobacteraceae bacterium]
MTATASADAKITVRDLCKAFGRQPLYDAFNLDFAGHKVTSIFGQNGCGKSTLMNMVAGLVSPDRGEVRFDGRPASKVRFGYVFQNYRDALLPWKRAADNIRYPLQLLGLPRAEQDRRLEQIVAEFRLPIDLKRYPYELSGGQQQAICIMRALVAEPEVLFLDEPFSALDYELTLFMRDQLQSIFATRPMTTILVSHDLEEAIYLADDVILLTRPPTRVARTVVVPIPRPRDADLLTAPAFVGIKANCLATFRREAQL